MGTSGKAVGTGVGGGDPGGYVVGDGAYLSDGADIDRRTQ